MASEVKAIEGMQVDEFDDLIEEIKASAADTDCAAHRPIAKALIKMLRVGKITVSMDSKLDQLVSRIPPPPPEPPAGKWPMWAKIGTAVGAALASAGAYFGGGGGQ